MPAFDVCKNEPIFRPVDQIFFSVRSHPPPLAQAAFLEHHPPSWRTRRPFVECRRSAELRNDLPAEFCGAGLTIPRIADEEDRSTGCSGPETHPSRAGEIERLMRMTDVGNNRRHRLAGYRFFHRPQELGD